MPALLLLTGPSSGLRYEIKSEATLGRAGNCEVPLEDGKVSRRHARIELRGGQAFLCDLGSRNGTLLNGERVSKEMLLRPGDRFQVGDTTVLFEPTAAAEKVDETTQADFDAVPVDDLLPSEGVGGFLVALGKAVLSAPSGPAVLRRGAELLLARFGAKSIGVLVQQADGLSAACVVGAAHLEVPKGLSSRVLTKGEVVWDGGDLCLPLGPVGAGLGVVFVERDSPFTPDERQLAATGARLLGDVWAHGQPHQPTLASAPVGTSESFRAILEQVRKAAPGKDAVAFCGAHGTGKRMLAQYLHVRSSRALGPSLLVDCREPAGVVEDALFGRPAGPGVPPQASALARADGGTLILHHAESLPKAASERLSRYLTRRSAPGLNGDDFKVDVRLVLTCGNTLSAMASAGHQPLINALGATEIRVPALKDHAGDIPELFAHFSGRVAATLKQDAPKLTSEALELLSQYPWPFNAEELRLMAERLALLYPDQEIESYKLPAELQKVTGEEKTPTLQDMIARLERDAISEALRQAKGKKIKAASILGISRPTLDKKIEDYNLKVEKVRDE